MSRALQDLNLTIVSHPASTDSTLIFEVRVFASEKSVKNSRFEFLVIFLTIRHTHKNSKLNLNEKHPVKYADFVNL